MRKGIIILLAPICLLLLTPFVYALDNPHDKSNSYTCSSCHFTSTDTPPVWFTQPPDPANPDTNYPMNRLCWSCHNDSTAPLERTHSQFRMTGVEGWTHECRACHNPHSQRQFRKWGSASYLETGASTSVTTNTITKTGAGWGDTGGGQWKGMLVIGNISYPNFNYRILSNTGDTLTVLGTIDTRYVKAGNTFAIVYGKLVKDYVSSRNVKFFRQVGNNSLADGDGIYDGVCEVCHTQTTYYKNDGTGLPHYVGIDCASCHSHLEGFKPVGGCDTCHGYPPIVDTATSPDGLVWSRPTGSTTAGKHNSHYTAPLSYSCDSCHYNNTVESGKHDTTPLKITMGFYLFGGVYQGGKYEGQVLASADYDATTTSPLTEVVENGNKKCSNLYCHSTAQGSGGSWPPTYATPVWDGTVVCGDCHKGNTAPLMDSGTHWAHVASPLSKACSTCHSGAGSGTASHVNNNINVSFASGLGGSYPSPNTPGYGYATCSNVYCHSNVQTSPPGGAVTYTNKPWGGSAVCGNCHKGIVSPNLMDSGSHTKHVSDYSARFSCDTCHKTKGSGTSYHADKNIDISIDLTYGGTYSGTPAPGDGYGNCSTSYCHSNGRPTPVYSNPIWGNTASGACGTCHNYTKATPPATGSHSKHVVSTGVYQYNCYKCHTNTVDNADPATVSTTGKDTYHVNKTRDVAMEWGGNWNSPGANQCNNVYCHSNAKITTGVITWTTPTWGGGALTCSGCHGNPPAYTSGGAGTATANSHAEHTGIGCQKCHNATTTDGTSISSSNHVDGSNRPSGSATGDVVFEAGGTYNYGVGSKTCSTTYCHGAGTPQWGGTLVGDCTDCHGFPPPTNAHAAHIQNATLLTVEYGNTEVKSNTANYAFGCGNCHPPTGSKSAKHVNGTVDISLNPADGGALKSKNDPSAGRTGTGGSTVCNKVYCHSNGAGGAASNITTAASPAWNTILTGNKCGACHGNPPQYASVGAGTAGANSHYNSTGFMGKEGGHMLTVHRDNIYNKVSGNGLITLDDAVSTDSRHGNPAVATTMACYVCHSGIVGKTAGTPGDLIDTYSMEGTTSSFKCSACHTGATLTKLQAGTINDKSKHVNGSANVVFATITMNSKAQLRDSSKPTGWTRTGTYNLSGSYDSASLNGTWNSGAKTCTTACHNGQTATWGDTSATCNSCHKDLP